MNWLMRLMLNLRPRLRGASIGSQSFVGPKCDWLQTSWRNIRIGDNVKIGRRAWMQTHGTGVGRIVIGNGTNIGRDVVISSATEIIIGEDCLLSFRVSIIDHDHEFVKGESPLSVEVGDNDPVQIGNRTFIGANTTVLKGSRIGNDCIIGANSLVSGVFPDNTIVTGVPARIIRYR